MDLKAFFAPYLRFLGTAFAVALGVGLGAALISLLFGRRSLVQVGDALLVAGFLAFLAGLGWLWSGAGPSDEYWRLYRRTSLGRSEKELRHLTRRKWAAHRDAVLLSIVALLVGGLGILLQRWFG